MTPHAEEAAGPCPPTVIHIVFAPFGLEPFRRFVNSYRRHTAGTPHMLLIAFKGFGPTSDLARYEALLDGIPHRSIAVPDGGFDIGTYLWLARRLPSSLLCLLNSTSVILADDWLAKLKRAFDEQGGGIVGATGSWESFATDVRRATFPYRGPPLRRLTVRFLISLRYARSFPAFPNPHVRTNGVLIDRATLLSVLKRAPRSKDEAHRFESGRRSMTRQLKRRGLPIRLVDRNGTAYPPDQWAHVPLFYGEGQDRLLIDDNRTEHFRQASAAEQAKLTQWAWLPLDASTDAE